jgi:DNA-directed RNA polymerase specialized sigma24 family protein
MDEQLAANNDRELADRIITGVAAFGELQDRFRKKLELYLCSLCDRADGRSQEKAVEIASQVLSDCFAKSPSLLEKWHGIDNLQAFLRTVAHNRLKSWWDSRDAAIEVDSNSSSITDARATAGDVVVDWDELNTTEKALAAGVEAAIKECPEGLLFLRLKGLHGVDQRVLSTVWGHHEAQTSRRIKEAMTLIRSVTADMAATCGIELDIATLQKALQANPSLLLGPVSSVLESKNTETLRDLADGHLDRSERARAVDLMCRNAAALGFFAQLLNRSENSRAVFVKDPSLDGIGARIADHIGKTLAILKPAEVRELVTPLMAEAFLDTLRSIRADGGTLWWLSPGEAVLEAVFNPLEPEISGKRQPLVSGIISLVLATSETICVASADSHHRHSAAIDTAMGKRTGTMIAVPFRVRDRVCGALTAVRFGDADPFGSGETGILERQASVLATMLDSILVARITGGTV